MVSSPLTRRLAAVGLLVGTVLLVGFTSVSTVRAFMDGQREIAAKAGAVALAARARGSAKRIRALDAPQGWLRAGFSRPMPDATGILQTAITHAADGQQVIVDGTDALPAEAVTRLSAVHLRATQAGLYAFLQAIEEQTPYILVPRLEVTPSRSADPEHGKPFVVQRGPAPCRAGCADRAVPSARGPGRSGSSLKAGHDRHRHPSCAHVAAEPSLPVCVPADAGQRAGRLARRARRERPGPRHDPGTRAEATRADERGGDGAQGRAVRPRAAARNRGGLDRRPAWPRHTPACPGQCRTVGRPSSTAAPPGPC